jgi:hypothetical protein
MWRTAAYCGAAGHVLRFPTLMRAPASALLVCLLATIPAAGGCAPPAAASTGAPDAAATPDGAVTIVTPPDASPVSTGPDAAPLALPSVASPDAAPLAPTGPDPVTAVWAAGDSDTIERDDQAAPRTSPVWDGTRVRLFGGRNEIVAFQLLVRAGGQGITALSARLPGLARDGEAIRYQAPAADPTDTRDRPIQLFSVNYMNVARASDATWIYVPGSAGAPARPTGWKPAQLVPENARAGKGGLPVAVRAGDTQSLWFEVYTGKTRTPGVYTGSISVTTDGHTREVPVSLEVLGFTLPDQNTLPTMLYFESKQPVLYQGRNLDDAYHRFAHRHRVELVAAYDEAGLTAAAHRFDGADFTPAAGYEGPGQGVGNKVVPASFYGPGAGWEDRATAWQRSDRWMELLASRVPGAITFLYMADEPGSSQFPGIRTIADNVHSNPGVGGKLPIFVTHSFTSGLDGAIDMWCSPPKGFDAAQAAAHASNSFWVYNGGRPAGPALVMDAPVSDAREIGWAAFKASLPGYFVWHSVNWHHNAQKVVGSLDQEVWTNPVTFDQRDASGNGSFANGDGVLMYPGTERIHPAEDRGIEGPIGTMMLANLRRGLQDHQYLTMAKQCGLDAQVKASLEAVVPRVFSAATGKVSFPEDSAGYEREREKLGRALVGCPGG